MSYWRLGITIFLALTLSTFVSGAFFKLWVQYDLRVASELAQEKLDSLAKQAEYEALLLSKRIQNNQRVNAEKRKNISRQVDKNKAAMAQRQRTCDFWKTEYSKNRTSYDLAMKNSACKPVH